MTPLRLGSLCSGYGGLEMGLQTVLGGTVAWHAEFDPAASRLLAYRHNAVPNLGDITAIGWNTVEPVDYLTAGFPCQDVSLAGARKGLRAGTRSGIWSHVATAINVLRPRLVLLENVRGLLSAGADSDVEPCPWCLGDAGSEHALRALGAVLGDLADIGYDARWCGLRAADVGAPHGRYRVFIAAWPHDSDTAALRRWRNDGVRVEGLVAGHQAGSPAEDTDGAARIALPGSASGQAEGRRARADAGRRGGAPPADAEGFGRDEGWPGSAGIVGGSDAALGRSATSSDAGERGAAINWGTYATAIHRWETVCGRRAPVPTIRGTRGQPKLNPAFVEWMMGLPPGWVTDVPGVSTNDQLKMLGNGVVPAQAAEALRFLLGEALVTVRGAA